MPEHYPQYEIEAIRDPENQFKLRPLDEGEQKKLAKLRRVSEVEANLEHSAKIASKAGETAVITAGAAALIAVIIAAAALCIFFVMWFGALVMSHLGRGF